MPLGTSAFQLAASAIYASQAAGKLTINHPPRMKFSGLALSDVEAEGGAPPVGPVRGIWGMFVRVRRLEGIPGLFKGEHVRRGGGQHQGLTGRSPVASPLTPGSLRRIV